MENICSMLYDMNQSKILFDPHRREVDVKTNKQKHKLDLMKDKSFCTAKETINKTKKTLSEWEKSFTMKQLTKD